MTEKCNHGIPMFEKDVRCIDCEIFWEQMVIESSTKSINMAMRKIKILEKEKMKARKCQNQN